MKRIAAILMLAFSCCCFTRINAETEEIEKGKPNAAALTAALMGIAGQLLTDLPSIITDISKFPNAVKHDVKDLQKGMIAAAALSGTAKQQKVEELFVNGVNLTIQLANILNKFMVIIAKIGPVAEAIDQTDGKKVNDAMILALSIMQMISKINIAMKNAIVAQGNTVINPDAKETPKLDPIPNL